jgi:hypothetical protein
MENKPKVRVLYNNCYGGFTFSQEAFLEINQRLTLQDRKPLTSVHSYVSISDRYDPIFLQVYDLLGSRFSGKHSSIQVELVDEKCKHFIDITEYDGLESVEINTENYTLFNIMNIIESQTFSDREKVQKIKSILEKK